MNASRIHVAYAVDVHTHVSPQEFKAKLIDALKGVLAEYCSDGPDVEIRVHDGPCSKDTCGEDSQVHVEDPYGGRSPYPPS